VVSTELSAEVAALRKVLLHLGHFDEAHCVSVAVHSPSLCSSEYIRAGLRQADCIAGSYGLSTAARWIAQLVS
jgi:hypothetical protein